MKVGGGATRLVYSCRCNPSPPPASRLLLQHHRRRQAGRHSLSAVTAAPKVKIALITQRLIHQARSQGFVWRRRECRSYLGTNTCWGRNHHE
jgi:hypothetical protein